MVRHSQLGNAPPGWIWRWKGSRGIAHLVTKYPPGHRWASGMYAKCGRLAKGQWRAQQVGFSAILCQDCMALMVHDPLLG